MDPCQPTNPWPLSTTADCQSQRDSDSSTSAIRASARAKIDSTSSATTSATFFRNLRVGPTVTVIAGVLLAVLVGGVGSARAAWRHIAILLSTNTSVVTHPAEPVPTDRAQNDRAQNDLVTNDRLAPQAQAEMLLESAVGDSSVAVEQLSSHLDGWQGKLQWSPQIANLTSVALASRDLRVRQLGVEVELAAYQLAKNTNSLNYVLHVARSNDHLKKTWALWSLGLLANRGVGSAMALQTLSAHLKDSDQDDRRWAVAALAVSGSPQIIAPLLRTMHDDPSPSVRESAASGLAESGMMTREQRLAAVPQLLNYTQDPALDEQTRTWAFQALACITGQHLPDDPAAWRLWYTSAKVN